MSEGFPVVASRSLLRSRAEVLARPGPVPRSPGVYAWYFDAIPPGIDAAGCYSADGLTLLYVGISPRDAPTNGRPPSRSNLRQRLRTHYAGNAAGSTLRKTLGCLLGIELRRVGSGERFTFTNPGEQVLDQWMGEHAFVAWWETSRPWEAELTALRSGLPLPLNVRDNASTTHTTVVTAARTAAMQRAKSLPIVVDSGGGRRPAKPLPAQDLPPDNPYSDAADERRERFADDLLAGKYPRLFDPKKRY